MAVRLKPIFSKGTRIEPFLFGKDPDFFGGKKSIKKTVRVFFFPKKTCGCLFKRADHHFAIVSEKPKKIPGAILTNHFTEIVQLGCPQDLGVKRANF